MAESKASSATARGPLVAALSSHTRDVCVWLQCLTSAALSAEPEFLHLCMGASLAPLAASLRGVCQTLRSVPVFVYSVVSTGSSGPSSDP